MKSLDGSRPLFWLVLDALTDSYQLRYVHPQRIHFRIHMLPYPPFQQYFNHDAIELEERGSLVIYHNTRESLRNYGGLPTVVIKQTGDID